MISDRQTDRQTFAILEWLSRLKTVISTAAVYVHGNGKLNIRLHNSTILTHIQSTMYTTLGNFKALNHVFKYPDLSITKLNLLRSGGSQTHMYNDTVLDIEGSRRKLTFLNLSFLILY